MWVIRFKKGREKRLNESVGPYCGHVAHNMTHLDYCKYLFRHLHQIAPDCPLVTYWFGKDWFRSKGFDFQDLGSCSQKQSYEEGRAWGAWGASV